jgi:hypothetical protein
MWTVGYGTLRSWDKVYSDQGAVLGKSLERVEKRTRQSAALLPGRGTRDTDVSLV